MTDKIRSIVFNLVFMTGSLAISIAMLWALFLPKEKCAQVVGDVYGGFMLWVTRVVMGIDLRIEGLENIPKDGPFILAAKHQSAYETLTLPFMGRFRYPAIVYKKSLNKIPVWGLYLGGMGQVSVDRAKGASALRAMTAACKKAVERGRPVIIFPQGTRVAVDAKVPYKAGLAKLYKDLGVPIVPLALNTGVFWGRNAFFKKPGTVVYKILPPIPPGRPPLQVMEEVEKMLEGESEKLVTEARQPSRG